MCRSKHCIDPKTIIKHSNEMENIYDNFDEYNPNKKCKILIVFDDMIANMVTDTKLNPIVTELFI